MKSPLTKPGKPKLDDWKRHSKEPNVFSPAGNPREGPPRSSRWIGCDPQLVWMAAAIDFEGHICIERANPSDRYPRARYWPIVSVSNTNKLILGVVKSIFDAPIYRTKRADATRKEQWHWQASSRRALAIIEAVRPYLIIKQEQADAVIEYMQGISAENRGIRLTKAEEARRELYYWRLRALNAKGPPATTERGDTPTG